MSTIVNRTVTQPNAALSLTYEWRWKGRSDVHGFRRLQVDARHSMNELADDGKRPNEVVVRFEHGQDRRIETIRIPREAAGRLARMLNDALDWDGSTP